MIKRLIGESEDFSEYEDLLALDAEQEKTLFDRPVAVVNPAQAYAEAKRLGKGNVPKEYEELMAENEFFAFCYAVEVLKERFPSGEAAMRNNPHTWYVYKDMFNIP